MSVPLKTIQECAGLSDQLAQVIDHEWPKGVQMARDVAMILGDLRVYLHMLARAERVKAAQSAYAEKVKLSFP